MSHCDLYKIDTAAKNGCGEAAFFLGCFYAGEEKERNKMIFYFELGSELGDSYATYELGRCFANGFCIPKDSLKALKLFHKAARQGHVEAQFELALHYKSIGNDLLMKEFYLQSALQGHVFAQFSLGHYWKNKNDLTESMLWFQTAAEQGLPLAMYWLGKCFQQQNDFVQALDWFDKAAFAGEPCLKYVVGLEYAPWSPLKSKRMFKEAAFQGHADAQYQYARHLSMDPTQAKEAVKFFKFAAKQHHIEAIFELGFCYQNGFGVEENKYLSLECFQYASFKGLKEATHYVKCLGKQYCRSF